jgi:hypothetical protein
LRAKIRNLLLAARPVEALPRKLERNLTALFHAGAGGFLDAPQTLDAFFREFQQPPGALEIQVVAWQDRAMQDAATTEIPEVWMTASLIVSPLRRM